jgi:hypothetical protein
VAKDKLMAMNKDKDGESKPGGLLGVVGGLLGRGDHVQRPCGREVPGTLEE